MISQSKIGGREGAVVNKVCNEQSRNPQRQMIRIIPIPIGARSHAFNMEKEQRNMRVGIPTSIL